MSAGQTLQASRFELKFVIDERCASRVCAFARSYLAPDEPARPAPDGSYPVNSLYLDSSDLVLYRQTATGLKNRFKLRVRFYDGDPDHPLFLEIKRRITGVICKERAMISRDGVRRLLQGYWPDSSYLMSNNGDPRAGLALQNFCNLYDSIRASSRVYVSYMRDAYVSPGSNQVRVTFDRKLLGSPFDWETFFLPPTEGAQPPIGNDDKVILELKFTDRFPDWMQEMVEVLNLQRCSVPKYNMCINSLGLQPHQRDFDPMRLMP